MTWMFAAPNLMEPHLQNFTAIDAFFAQEEWAKLRRQSALAAALVRLEALASWMDIRPGK